MNEDLVDKLLTNSWKQECEKMRKLAGFGLGMAANAISDFIKEHPENAKNIFIASQIVVCSYVFTIIKNNKEDIQKAETCMEKLLGLEGLAAMKERVRKFYE